MHKATSSLSFFLSNGKGRKETRRTITDYDIFERRAGKPRVASSAGVGRERNHARSHGLLAACCSNVQFNIAFLLTNFSAKERFLVVHRGMNQKAIPNEHLAFSTYKNSVYRMSKLFGPFLIIFVTFIFSGESG